MKNLRNLLKLVCVIALLIGNAPLVLVNGYADAGLGDIEEFSTDLRDLWTVKISNNLNRKTVVNWLEIKDPKYPTYKNDEFELEDRISTTIDKIGDDIKRQCIAGKIYKINVSDEFKKYDFGGQFFEYQTPSVIDLGIAGSLRSSQIPFNNLSLFFHNADKFRNIPMDKKEAKDFLNSRKVSIEQRYEGLSESEKAIRVAMENAVRGNTTTVDVNRKVYITPEFKLGDRHTTNRSTGFSCELLKVHVFNDESRTDLLAVITPEGAMSGGENGVLTEKPFNVRSILPNDKKWRYFMQYYDENKRLHEMTLSSDLTKVFIPESASIEYLERSYGGMGAKGSPDFQSTKGRLMVLWTTKKMFMNVFKVTKMKNTPENSKIFKDYSDEELLAHVQSFE